MATRKKSPLTGIPTVLGATWHLKQPGVAIEIRGDEFARQAYLDASAITKLARVQSFREPLLLARDKVVIPAIQKNFAAQGRPPWVKLSPITIQNRMELSASGRVLSVSGNRQKPTTKGQRAKLGGGIRILDWSGRLKRAATAKNMWDIKNNQLIFRANFFAQKVPYGPFHQLGTRNMHQRVFISLRFSDEDAIKDIFDAWYTMRVYRHWVLRNFRG